MGLIDKPSAKMKLIGGRLFLDFINTVGARIPGQRGGADLIQDDKLIDYLDLVAWGVHVDLITKSDGKWLAGEAKHVRKSNGVFRRAIALREALYRICRSIINEKQPGTDDLKLLNQELKVAHDHREVSIGSSDFIWKWSEMKSGLDSILWRIADSAVEMLTTADLTRLHECEGEDCGWLFEDTSKNRRRHWCDMQDCGNHAKVRTFRERRKRAT